MQISHNGIEFLKDAEGFRDKAYRDSVGVWTVGYGTTRIYGKPVEAGQTCTQNEAELWLTADTASVQTAINRSVRAPLRQNQYDALVSFVYNIGIQAFQNSTMLKKLNAGDYSGAAAEFPRWDKAGGQVIPGLHSRRLREQSLFTQ